MAMENVYSLDCSFRMSDILNRLGQEKFKGHLQFNVNQSLSYVRHSCISASEHLVTVHVGYDTLKHWYQVKNGLQCTYVQIVNGVFRNQGLLLRVKDECTRCGEVNTKLKAKNGST